MVANNKDITFIADVLTMLDSNGNKTPRCGEAVSYTHLTLPTILRV